MSLELTGENGHLVPPKCEKWPAATPWVVQTLCPLPTLHFLKQHFFYFGLPQSTVLPCNFLNLSVRFPPFHGVRGTCCGGEWFVGQHETRVWLSSRPSQAVRIPLGCIALSNKKCCVPAVTLYCFVYLYVAQVTPPTSTKIPACSEDPWGLQKYKEIFRGKNPPARTENQEWGRG